MTLVFTSCSVNYLAQAKTLADSLRAAEPTFRFFICLVDELPEGDLGIDLSGVEVVPISTLAAPELREMTLRYDVIELSTAVKPFFFTYLLERFGANDRVVYLDPDTMVFGPLKPVADGLEHHEILVTPHILTPSAAYPWSAEALALKYGLYNLGFLAIRRGDTSQRFLAWWSERLVTQCKRRQHEGQFVDQLIVNLAPVFFDVGICRHPGMNVAYWNFAERLVSTVGNRHFVGKEPLIFAHFSSFDPRRPELVSTSRSCHVTFAERPDLRPLFEHYRKALLGNNFETLSARPCHYIQVQRRASPWRYALMSAFRTMKSWLPGEFRAKILRVLASS